MINVGIIKKPRQQAGGSKNGVIYGNGRTAGGGTASSATEAEHAQRADSASRADTADTAATATTAKSADRATTAESADKATTAETATIAETAETANEAAHATKASNLDDDSSDWTTIDNKDKAVKREAESYTDKLIEGLGDKYLSKVNDDTAKGLITFLKGLVSDEIKSQGYDAASDDDILSGKGFHYYTKDGKAHLLTDFLTVRQKTYFSELDIRKISFIGGDNIMSAAGNTIVKVEQVSDSNGEGYKCYFMADDGEETVENYWHVGDQAMCRTFKAKTGSTEFVSNRYYWRLVTAVGTEQVETGKDTSGNAVTRTMGYVVLSDNEYALSVIYNSDGTVCYPWDEDPNTASLFKCKDTSVAQDTPAEGDSIVQMGSQSDKGRMKAIRLRVTKINDEAAPAIVFYSGISSYDLKETFTISPDGIDGEVKMYNIKIVNDAGEPVSLTNWRGVYDGSTTYSKGDMVTYNGQMWLWDNTTPVSGTEPSTGNGWTLVVEKGDKGDDGHSPYIDGGYWYYWDGTGYVKGDKAQGEKGDDGHSPYIDGGYWYYWDGTGYVKGDKAQGEPGDPGDPGAAAVTYSIEPVKENANVEITDSDPDASGNVNVTGTLTVDCQYRVYKVTGDQKDPGATRGVQISAAFDNGATDGLTTTDGSLKVTASGLPYSSSDGRRSIVVTFTYKGTVIGKRTVAITLAPQSEIVNDSKRWARIMANGNDISLLQQKADSISLKVDTLRQAEKNLLDMSNTGAAETRGSRYTPAERQYRLSNISAGKTYTITLKAKVNDGTHIGRLFAWQQDNSGNWTANDSVDVKSTEPKVYSFALTTVDSNDIQVRMYEYDGNGNTPSSYEGAVIDWIRIDEGDLTGNAPQEWEPTDKDVEAVNLLPDHLLEDAEAKHTDNMGTRETVSDQGTGISDVMSIVTKGDGSNTEGAGYVRFNRNSGYSSSDIADGLRWYIPYHGAGAYTISGSFKNMHGNNASSGNAIVFEIHPCDANKTRIRYGTSFAYYEDGNDYGWTYGEATLAVNDTELGVEVAWLEVRLFMSRNGDMAASRLCVSKCSHATVYNAQELSAARGNEARQLATGIDIYKGRIVATADNFSWRDNSGNAIAEFDSEKGATFNGIVHARGGDFTGTVHAQGGDFTGTVKAVNFFNSILNVFPEEYVPREVASDGAVQEEQGVKGLTRSSSGSKPWTMTVGDSYTPSPDIIILSGDFGSGDDNATSGITVILPNANDETMRGKMIRIIDDAYSTVSGKNYKSTVAVTAANGSEIANLASIHPTGVNASVYEQPETSIGIFESGHGYKEATFISMPGTMLNGFGRLGFSTYSYYWALLSAIEAPAYYVGKN